MSRVHLIIIGFLFFSNQSKSQFTVIINAQKVPAVQQGDTLFVAGNFNGWNPSKTMLTKTKNAWTVTLENIPSDLQFKFTKGGWSRVEVDAGGNQIENRFFNIQSDTVLNLTIARFSNPNKPIPKKHTKSSQVRVMDTAFAMPQLNTRRRIWIYLPKTYFKQPARRYPVLYMHDGQNLFDEAITAFGEWGVDEALDSLQQKHREAIVVGIDNGPRRLNEYNPFENPRFGEGNGDEYLQFLVNSLMPFVDRHYRTLKGRQHTIIAGSSMGGLISYYAMLKYPDVFGKAGIFSPAFWAAKPGIDSLTKTFNIQLSGKMFFYMGGKEGGQYLSDMMEIETEIAKRTSVLILSITDPESGHNEKAWRKWFPSFYEWIMRDDLNYVIPTKKITGN